jgi:4-alpha-glucanotransferase
MTRVQRAHGGPLRELARLYGIQTAYYDVAHRRKSASPDTLLLVLKALGAPLESFDDVPAALRERRQVPCKRGVEPVVVAWDGEPPKVELRVPAHRATGPVACSLLLEGGERRNWTCDLSRLPGGRAMTVEGVRYVTKRLSVPDPLPWGYHRLRLENQGQLRETQIISAPFRADGASDESAGRAWGVFLPLYALHSKRSWGAGDFTDLETLVDWVAPLGASVVATLPLLAAFLDAPYDPSPYAPASRLFWSEFYIDVTRVPELSKCPAAQALLESAEVQAELELLRASSLIEYRRQMALKRRVLEALAQCFFADMAERHPVLQRFVEDHPQVEDYARFRATMERQGSPWPSWPLRLRDGVLREGDYDERSRRYHLYVQWVAHEQMGVLTDKTKASGVGLYLDLPLGVHPYSYDVWRERSAFALDVSGGAPPDAVFTKGQNWGFPPLHPEAIREQAYRYVVAYLRHQLQYTSLLRIDHVMALHRLFWIPKGLEPREGVYVRYPADELYAILNLESHRHRVAIVGENLGTVPTYVNSTMARHNVRQMYVLEYELNPRAREVLRPVPQGSVASLNTHDMPSFAAYWQGLDIEDRRELGLLNSRGAEIERKSRRTLERALKRFLKRQRWLDSPSPRPQGFLRGCLAFLSASPAEVVLINVEDLWLETHPQNVPGTHDERPNWRRKAGHSLEALREMSTVRDVCRDVDALRRRLKKAKRGNRENRKR